MNAGIIGLGFWVPDSIRRNTDWPKSFVDAFHERRAERKARDIMHIEESGEARPFDELFAKYALPHESDPFKGTIERRVSPFDVPTSQGDAIAGRRALEEACVRPDEVDLVLSSALPQDKLVPSNAPAIQHLLGCTNAAALGVEAYCASFVAQLDLAAGLVSAGRARYVLCVQSHQIARVNDMTLPSSPVFGDAAAACVVGQVPDGYGVLDSVRGGDGSLRDGVTFSFLSKPDAIWWKDAAGPIVPSSDDPRAVRRIARHVLEYPVITIRELLARSKTPIDAISTFAMIQPMVWYQPAVAEALGVSAERLPSTHASYAHIGASSLVANLMRARDTGLLRSGNLAVVYGHGAGITRHASLVRWFQR